MRSPKEYLILPLDCESLQEALPIVEELKDHVGMFKIGLTLFVGEGLKAIDEISKVVGSNKIFFDLKFLDIPETVASVSGAIVSAKGHGVRFVTVHASEGERPIRAAVEGMKRGLNGTKVIGITVLTSVSESDFGKMGYIQRTVKERVLFLAVFAKNAGAAGVVCSGHEVREIKKEYGPEFITITPGIRPIWGPVAGDDQRRIMTPGEAIRAGTDYIVVGRSIIQSTNRIDAAQRVVDEIGSALSSRPVLA